MERDSRRSRILAGRAQPTLPVEPNKLCYLVAKPGFDGRDPVEGASETGAVGYSSTTLVVAKLYLFEEAAVK